MRSEAMWRCAAEAGQRCRRHVLAGCSTRARPTAGALAALSLLAIAMEPRVTAQWSSFPLLLSATVLGYLGGVALPARVQQVVHPILVCGAAPNAAAALQGLLTGAGYWATLHGYVTQV